MQQQWHDRPEHIEHIEDRKNNGHVAGRQKCCQMVHRTIEVPREALLDKQCRELQHRQQQVLIRLIASHVARQHPRAVSITAPLQDIVQFVQHVHPVWQLTLRNNHSIQQMHFKCTQTSFLPPFSIWTCVMPNVLYRVNVSSSFCSKHE